MSDAAAYGKGGEIPKIEGLDPQQAVFAAFSVTFSKMRVDASPNTRLPISYVYGKPEDVISLIQEKIEETAKQALGSTLDPPTSPPPPPPPTSPPPPPKPQQGEPSPAKPRTQQMASDNSTYESFEDEPKDAETDQPHPEQPQPTGYDPETGDVYTETYTEAHQHQVPPENPPEHS